MAKRFFELLPGMLTWGTLCAIVVFSWLTPAGVAIFIILFDAYWLLKTVYFSLHLRASFGEMRQRMKKNWMRELEHLSQRGVSLPFPWKEVYHVVIFPMYNEPYDIIRESFRSLAHVNYPKENLIVVLATEERAGARAAEIAHTVEEEFAPLFLQFL